MNGRTTASRPRALAFTLGTALAACSPGGILGQAPARGALEEISVHGVSLEGNLLGLSPDRDVVVYLPPSYRQSPTRRFPVLYLLHGIQDAPKVWVEPWGQEHRGYATIQELMDRGIAEGRLQEIIVVMPDAEKSCHYTDSPVKGRWATFIARDLVAAIDSRYRTAPNVNGRAIFGHSMGGHGTLKIVMTQPGIFGAAYAMNPSLLGWGGDVSADNPMVVQASRLTSFEQLARAPFYAQAVVGVGQCFAPDRSAPLLTAMPYAVAANGAVQPGPGFTAWTAQMPLQMARQHVEALKTLRGLGFDTGDRDEFTHIPPTTQAFHHLLDSLGVPHRYEMYDGDHRNRLWGREGRLYGTVLPFLSGLVQVDSAAAAVPITTTATTAVPERRADRRTQERLWDAVQANDMRRAEEAVTAGADVNALDTRRATSGRRPLHYAALGNRAEMVRWLVQRGAQVNLANGSGFTPLHHAAESGSLDAIRVLLELGAEANARLPSGSTPLAVARQRGHQEAVALLAPATRP